MPAPGSDFTESFWTLAAKRTGGVDGYRSGLHPYVCVQLYINSGNSVAKISGL